MTYLVKFDIRHVQTQKYLDEQILFLEKEDLSSLIRKGEYLLHSDDCCPGKKKCFLCQKESVLLLYREKTLLDSLGQRYFSHLKEGPIQAEKIKEAMSKK